MSKTPITINIDPDLFNPVYLKYSHFNETPLQIVFGGSSSGKSVSLADRTVIRTAQGRNTLICRKVANTIRRSCFNEVVKSIHKFGMGKLFSINKSDLIITYIKNDKQMLFAGLDDVEKVKSITPADGVLNDIWVEEATEIIYDDFKQLKKRLRGFSEFKKSITLSFNPILKTHWIYREWFKDQWIEGKNWLRTKDYTILKTTYLDNNFLTPEDKYELENESNRYYYDVYTLGNWGVLGHIIYTNWEIRNFEEDKFDNYKNGVDWGFNPHPFAFVRMHYDKTRSILYICDEICQTDLLNKDSAKLVKEKIGNELVTCDSAEPKSVVEYTQLGINAIPAQKGKGSVEYGIKFMQALKIVIHPRCQSFINQIQTYQLKEDKNGNALPKPIDKDDDLLDAARYGLEQDMFMMETPPPPKTVEDLKTMDIFEDEYEDLEDNLHVTYRHGTPIAEDNYKSDSVSGY